MDIGFELNHYDPCVANKIINGQQCTIVWYVDDTKISHVDPNVVSDIIKKIETKFGKMSVTRGKDHEFLGMKIKFDDNQTLRINMSSYVEDAIQTFPEPITTKASTPANKNLFTIDGTLPILPKNKGEIFHSLVAKLLYITKRGRPDIQLAIAFLCTRVSCASLQDWEKLHRVLRYLYGTKNDDLILGADALTAIHTWVDASYGVHGDMKSHTGGVISFGTGAVITKSSKQKLNTKSSTEAELVGANDCLPATIWARMFLKAQGHTLVSNKLHQDNQSAMKLAMNGRSSCGQKSRHIDIRFFFIKDRLKTEHIQMTYCPTEAMLADFFTKPLQGHLFDKFKRVLMGQAHINTLVLSSPVRMEERVENNDNNDNVSLQFENNMEGSAIRTSEERTQVVDSTKNGTATEWTLVQGKKTKKGKHSSRGKSEEKECGEVGKARADESSHSLELIQLEN